MPRIAGINIPENKRIDISLTYIFGIGNSLSKDILEKAKIDPSKKAVALDAEEMGRLTQEIEKNHRVEGDLRRDVMMHIKRLKDINSWRGVRHIKRLPVRGQRTKTNTRTIRHNVRKTVGSGKKGAASPT